MFFVLCCILQCQIDCILIPHSRIHGLDTNIFTDTSQIYLQLHLQIHLQIHLLMHLQIHLQIDL